MSVTPALLSSLGLGVPKELQLEPAAQGPREARWGIPRSVGGGGQAQPSWASGSQSIKAEGKCRQCALPICGPCEVTAWPASLSIPKMPLYWP